MFKKMPAPNGPSKEKNERKGVLLSGCFFGGRFFAAYWLKVF